MPSPRIKRFEAFHEVLVEAQSFRDYLPMTFHNNDVDPYWNHYEKLTMLRCVNQEREALDKTPVTWQDITSVELMASGHIDYTKKFALYSAELVEK